MGKTNNRAHQAKWYASNRERKQQSVRRRWLKHKAIVNAHKDRPCVDCGVKYPTYVMDFDHLSDKEFGISRSIGTSLERLLAEIAKCDVVCSNCHRIRTWLRSSVD